MYTKVFVAGLLCLLVACAREQQTVAPAGSAPDPAVREQNGMLIFKTHEDFVRIRTQLDKATRQQLDQWENQFPNFTSQRFIYEDVLDLDLLHKERVSALPTAELEKVKNELGPDFYTHTSVRENQDLLAFDDLGYTLKIQGHDPHIERFVNRDGLVQIGDSIYEYKENSIKIIEDGNRQKLAQLAGIQRSSLEQKVVVINIKKRVLTDSEEGGKNLRLNFQGNTSCTGTIGKERVIGRTVISERQTYDHDGRFGYPGQEVFQAYSYLEATNQYRGLFGWEGKRTGALAIYGTINVAIYTYQRQDVPVEVVTGGELYVTITGPIYTGPWANVRSYPLLLSGSLDFYGRGGTWCNPDL